MFAEGEHGEPKESPFHAAAGEKDVVFERPRTSWSLDTLYRCKNAFRRLCALETTKGVPTNRQVLHTGFEPCGWSKARTELLSASSCGGRRNPIRRSCRQARPVVIALIQPCFKLGILCTERSNAFHILSNTGQFQVALYPCQFLL